MSTGLHEAGDFIFIHYLEGNRIRIGFDHWFLGGTLTAPIDVDYDAEHTLEISMGSLFPPAGDFVFAGWDSASVDRLKRRVTVKLDGRVLFDLPSPTYDSDSRDVTVGRNDIRGTSAGPRFFGEILSVERVWPESP